MSTAKSPSGTPPQAELLPPISPGIRAALRFFVARFPELLKEHPNKWVACDGNGILGVSDSWDVLYNRCLKKLKPDDFIVDYVMPGAIDDIYMPSLMDPA